LSLFWLCLEKNFRFSSSSAATRPATDYNLKKLLLRPPVVAIAGRQNSPPITTSSADNERARKGTTNEHPGRKTSNRKRQTGNGPRERAIADRTNGPRERAIAYRTNGPRERATVGTGAGNGPQKEWAKGMGPFIVADYGGLSPLPGSSNRAGLLVTCLLNLEFTKMEGL
jgi:hypothetical protein